MVSPYSQGNSNFDISSRMRADNIFSEYEFYKEIVNTNDIIFSNAKEMIKRYKQKNILIIGGGPSTKELLDSNYEHVFSQYDYLWSVNSFFLNPKLKNVKIDLAMMMLEPDLKSKEFIDYIDKYEPYIGFELHDKWKHEKIKYKKLFMMQTRFYGILGACQRMIIFACFLRANNIGFVGLDGLKSMKAADHSFEKGKNNLPHISDENVFQYQSDEFWNYVNNMFPNVKITNHGYDNNYHRNLKLR